MLGRSRGDHSGVEPSFPIGPVYNGPPLLPVVILIPCDGGVGIQHDSLSSETLQAWVSFWCGLIRDSPCTWRPGGLSTPDGTIPGEAMFEYEELENQTPFTDTGVSNEECQHLAWLHGIYWATVPPAVATMQAQIGAQPDGRCLLRDGIGKIGIMIRRVNDYAYEIGVPARLQMKVMVDGPDWQVRMMADME